MAKAVRDSIFCYCRELSRPHICDYCSELTATEIAILFRPESLMLRRAGAAHGSGASLRRESSANNHRERKI